MRLLSCLALLAPFAFADETKKKDEDRFQGTWSVVKFEAPGEETQLEKERVAKMSIVFKGDAMESHLDGTVRESYRIKLDASKKPRHIDILDMRPKRSPLLGIYEIDGDTLKICWNKTDAEKGRPTEFSSTATNKCHLIILKRKAK
jgi:uncharacterized protein (TIGR03067 family)